MKIKIYVATLMLVILAMTTANAELPYESDYEYALLLTGGKLWDSPHSNQSQIIYNFNYSYQNKISIGISRHYSSFTYSVYEGTGDWNDTGFLNTPDDSIVTNGQDYIDRYAFLEQNVYEDLRYFTNIYVQINPFQLYQIELPISISIQVAMQDIADYRNLIYEGFIYKKFRINDKSFIQPILSIGYGDISSVSSSRRQKYGISFIYAFQLNKKTDILIAPEVDRYWYATNYSIQFGISKGI